MHLRIFTLPFDPVLEGFPDEIVSEFCLNKRVHRLDSQFFQQEGKTYWAVSVHYEIVAKGKDKIRDLDENQKLLFEHLREWRRETAHKDGIPVYLIATNQQLVEIVRKKVKTPDGLKGIKGLGRGKTERYGRRMLAVALAFYDTQKQAEEPPKEPIPF